MNSNNIDHLTQLAIEIKQLGKEIGFNQIGITDTNFNDEINHLNSWLEAGYHGSMEYFKRHFESYKLPQKLLPDAVRVICCSINYSQSPLKDHPIASFAQTQDYSPIITDLLNKFVEKIAAKTNISFKSRVIAGNAPILEKALGFKAGLGWYGKNSVLINEQTGSFFFLGEILIDIPLPIDRSVSNRCGNCSKCIDACPTKALVAPYQLDANGCISYLTGVFKGVIPEELRPLIGNKIFGCDRCQLACPWNKLSKNDNILFRPYPHFSENNLIEWLLWNEKEFLEKTQNSPIKRIGYERWLRNIAIALGNSPKESKILDALKTRLDHPSELVREHLLWAIKKHL